MLRGRVGKNLRGSGRGQDTAVEGHALIMSALSPPFEGPHKPESRTTVGSSSSAPGYISKHMKAQTRKNTCAPVFTPALSTAAKLAVTEVSVDRRAGKEGVVWMCSGILLILKKEALSPAATQMNREDTLLSETSLSQNDKYCRSPPT